LILKLSYSLESRFRTACPSIRGTLEKGPFATWAPLENHPSHRKISTMEKAFRPIPLAELSRWIFAELEASDTVLGIPKANFAIPAPQLSSTLLGQPLAAPLGVAAGPHTQLAQNLVSAWLCGARFMELKTVQILDELEVSRPCIDSADETYNCEWSQELKLEQSFTEYLNAWVLIHALAHRQGLKNPGTLFAMSVGYNLEGIQSPRVQAFIAAMRDAGPRLDQAIEIIAEVYPAVRTLAIPRQLSNHITLSTMHGCPPSEIERIARYLLLDMGVHTWVKLNPTLLGPETLRGLLNERLGFEIEVPDAAFEHDPSFADAMAMVRNLAGVAKNGGASFGLKLSNTLEVVNHRPVFPANEKMMYLSGRALHALTLTLAHRVTENLDGQVPISFCGGADALNFPDLVADGLSPITVCTDLLKPGGYARLQQYLVNLETALARVGAASLEAFVQATSEGQGARVNLARHAAQAPKESRFARRERPLAFKGPRRLEAFDCIAAPCLEACPAHQNIPDYLWQVAQGNPSAALESILCTNPQPGITGSVCDHPCTERCVRNFFDAPLAIREIKRFAFEHGTARAATAAPKLGIKVAVVGAGPAGLSAAYYLACLGFAVEVFEARATLGGMVSGLIPGYRLSDDSLQRDLARLEKLGVTFHLGKALGRDLSLASLRTAFAYVFLGIGAQKGKRLGIPGEDTPGVLDALVFLRQVRDGQTLNLGRNVLIIGGGNTAMDAARTARRLVKQGEVTLVYRRTRAEMPADPEEIRDCLEEGVTLRNLVAPARVVAQQGRVSALACTRMKLGEKDASGRRRPVPIEGAEDLLTADTVIPAIGQDLDVDFLDGLEVRLNRDGTFQAREDTCETSVSGLFVGGDALRGPASVIKAIADGRTAAEEMGRRHGRALEAEPLLEKHLVMAEVMARKATHLVPQTVPVLPLEGRSGFEEVVHTFTAESAAQEASRCLDCDDLCSLCVTVCPNRANLAFATEPVRLELPNLVMRGGKLAAEDTWIFAVDQRVQILNLGDACNECGNCDTFCPTSGAPYKEKPRFWIDPEAFEESKRDAYRWQGSALEAKLGGQLHRIEPVADGVEYRNPELHLRFSPKGLEIISFGALAEGTRLDLKPFAFLLVLLQSRDAVRI
jgi:putative selenate reductase